MTLLDSIRFGRTVVTVGCSEIALQERRSEACEDKQIDLLAHPIDLPDIGAFEERY